MNNLGTRATYTQQHRSAQRPQLSVDGPDLVVVVMCSWQLQKDGCIQYISHSNFWSLSDGIIFLTALTDNK